MRTRSMHFYPVAFNFSQLDERQINEIMAKEEDNSFDKEKIILNVIYSLKKDKEKIVFLLEILREYGYQLDCESIAKSLKIERRWYQRIKENMRRAIKYSI